MATPRSLGRLHYFNQRGRAEIVRLVCAYGRVPLEEVEEPLGREFLARKPAFPCGQLPMMEIQGKLYSQSVALARYAARQVGLYPRGDDLAALKVDMVMDACADIHVPVLRATFIERDPESRAKLAKALVKHTLPGILRGLHERVGGDSGEDGPFVLGQTLSVADIVLFDVLTNRLEPNREALPIDYASDFPKLVELARHVSLVPPIADYLRVRNTQKTTF
ncbi:hypothetical protein PybrP1_008184 [[Pythium] brassicae (nom. inval.)]|nr:hypothetical protein PybrP1_008184 [[Pythium] brassicae (nom. inval.)]